MYSDNYRWEKREVAVDDIVLSGMGETLTDVIDSSEVGRSLRKFIEYIKNHADDPRFDELKPRAVLTDRQIILVREHEGVLKMLDGSHRLLSMVMNGATHVTAYVAVAKHSTLKPMTGDAIFLRLRCFWQSTNDESFKASIEQTVAGMVAETRDGESAVRSYWIAMGSNDEVKAAGRRILDQHKKPA